MPGACRKQRPQIPTASDETVHKTTPEVFCLMLQTEALNHRGPRRSLLRLSSRLPFCAACASGPLGYASPSRACCQCSTSMDRRSNPGGDNGHMPPGASRPREDPRMFGDLGDGTVEGRSSGHFRKIELLKELSLAGSSWGIGQSRGPPGAAEALSGVRPADAPPNRR